MTFIKKYWIGGAILLIILGAVAYGVLDRHAPLASMPSNTVASTTDVGGITVQTTGGNATVTEVPVDAPMPVPSLDRPIAFTGSVLPPEAQVIVKAQMLSLIATLKKNPNDLSSWIRLGGDFKSAGDYASAAELWKYVSAVAPTDEISVANLADLYTNFIKDYPKAEAAYRKAIVNDPHNIDNYRNLYSLYHYLYKTGTSAAADALKEGLKNNPGNADLIALQSQDAASTK